LPKTEQGRVREAHMMDKKRVLFVCVHNSARSQMAEAFLRKLAGDRFEVMSAGLEPATLNPLVVDVMKEVGIDISGNQTKSAFDLFKKGELFSYVISVCDAASAEMCPLFPGLLTAQIHWSFADPSSFTGTHEEKLAQTRLVRDAIKTKIEEWLKEIAA
jgi:arsenate reductase (thioredoxin)